MQTYLRLTAILFITILAQSVLLGQGIQKKVVLDWKGVQTIRGINYDTVSALCADGLGNNSAKNYTPEYSAKFTLPANIGSCDILVTNTEW